MVTPEFLAVCDQLCMTLPKGERHVMRLLIEHAKQSLVVAPDGWREVVCAAIAEGKWKEAAAVIVNEAGSEFRSELVTRVLIEHIEQSLVVAPDGWREVVCAAIAEGKWKEAAAVIVNEAGSEFRSELVKAQWATFR